MCYLWYLLSVGDYAHRQLGCELLLEMLAQPETEAGMTDLKALEAAIRSWLGDYSFEIDEHPELVASVWALEQAIAACREIRND